MKSETQVEQRLKKLKKLYANADSGSGVETILMSAIDEMEWVLR